MAVHGFRHKCDICGKFMTRYEFRDNSCIGRDMDLCDRCILRILKLIEKTTDLSTNVTSVVSLCHMKNGEIM